MRMAPNEKAEHILRAMDINTGTIKWELTEAAGANGWGGTISTATGLVFFGEESGEFSAADATTGKVLWSFYGNQNWKASPMAYMFDGKEYSTGRRWRQCDCIRTRELTAIVCHSQKFPRRRPPIVTKFVASSVAGLSQALRRCLIPGSRCGWSRHLLPEGPFR